MTITEDVYRWTSLFKQQEKKTKFSVSNTIRVSNFNSFYVELHLHKNSKELQYVIYSSKFVPFQYKQIVRFLSIQVL